MEVKVFVFCLAILLFTMGGILFIMLCCFKRCDVNKINKIWPINKKNPNEEKEEEVTVFMTNPINFDEICQIQPNGDVNV